MEHSKQPVQIAQSSFFVLNIWEEELGAGHTEWRGEIMDVENGAVYSFDDWPEVVDLIADALHKLRPSETASQSGLTPEVRSARRDARG